MPSVGKGVKNHCLIITNYAINSWGQKLQFLRNYVKENGKYLVFWKWVTVNHKYLLTGCPICKIIPTKFCWHKSDLGTKGESLFPSLPYYSPPSTYHPPPSPRHPNLSITSGRPLQSPRAQSHNLFWMLLLSTSSSTSKTPFPFQSHCSSGLAFLTSVQTDAFPSKLASQLPVSGSPSIPWAATR